MMTRHTPIYTGQIKGLRSIVLAAIVFLANITLPPPIAEARADNITDIFSANDASSKVSVDHAAWSDLLKKYVIADNDGINRVDYKAFKAEAHSPLKSYIAQLTAIDPRTLNKNEQFAYWANLYNAKTIDVILDHYPVDSIRNISLESGLFDLVKKTVGVGGPWKTKVVTIAGHKLSLDNIEHDVLRPTFQDPRVHYAVNCASIGCPNIGTQAFTADNLEDMLESNAKAYINHPRGVTVANGKAVASSIYDWFITDFGGDESGILEHVKKYASDDLKSKLEKITEIDSYKYDWSLNDKKR